MSDISVTVVIPHFEQHAQLALTLEALNHQTFATSRLQVVVADDGSSRPPARSAPVRYDLVIARQEHDGFGLARARNLGAGVAEGDVVIFLDADMLPEPGFVTAHIAAVAGEDDCVSIGHRVHVDVEGVTVQEIVGAVGSGGGLASLFDGRPRAEPLWRVDHLCRTDDLRNDFPESYRIASGGNLSLWRTFYWACGGTDPAFRQWGGEDVEFAFRATQHGATFVYTRAALAWHQGLGSAPDEAERRSQREQRPLLANRIADRHLRDDSGGRVHTVPHLSVLVEMTTGPAEDVEVLVDGLLRHPLGCEVRVSCLSTDQARVLERAFSADARVSIGALGVSRSAASEPSVVSSAPFQAVVRMEVPPSAATVLAGVQRLERAPRVGVVRIENASAVVYCQELAARLARRQRVPMASSELVDALAADGGEDRIPSDGPPPLRHAGMAMDGADILRDLWWRLSPRQRRFVERSARMSLDVVARLRRLLVLSR